MSLLFRGAKFSYYILLLISLPVLINARYILSIWLDHVPEHTVIFVQLVLIFGLSESISGPLITAMLATGNIRNYQLVVGGLQMMNLPISYFLLRYGASPESVLVVAVVISQVCLASRLFMLSKMIGLNIFSYLKNVYANTIIVTIVSFPIPYFMSISLDENLMSFIIVSILSLGMTGTIVFYLGCKKEERQYIIGKIRNKIHKK